MTSTERELLPCPFCGREAEIFTPAICLGDDEADVDWMQPGCKENCCFGQRVRFTDHNRQSENFLAARAKAITAWNTRTPSNTREDALEEARWLEPYRTMDASGTPDSAGQVGWNWLGEIAQQERAEDAVLLEINGGPLDADGKYGILYRSTKPVAAYFVIRDAMNFAVLFRWLKLNPTNPIPGQSGEERA